MTVTLYRYSGKNIVANKQLPASGPDVLTINADYGFEGDQDCDKPSIIIESATKPTWTYCYIDSFSRYYYVTSVSWISGSLWRLTLRVDVLKTFYTDIQVQSGTILYSGLGNAKYYDPRVVYNKPTIKFSFSPYYGQVNDNSGLQPYYVVACRYVAGWPGGVTNFLENTIIHTTTTAYIIMNHRMFFDFISWLIGLTEQQMAAVSEAIVSVTKTYWLDLSGFDESMYQPRSIYFTTPETYAVGDPDTGIKWDIPLSTDPNYKVYFIGAEHYMYARYIAFHDSAIDYSDRKAQRLIDIPFVGQLNIDLDSLGLESIPDVFNIGVKISYDFGGNEYVVTPGYGPYGTQNPSSFTYYPDMAITYTNKYQLSFVTKGSYSGESETRTAQILSLLGTVAAGIVTGIATEGASVPATIASLGIGVANMALTDQKIQYAKAVSLGMSGTSNGGSMYNTFYTPGAIDPTTGISATPYQAHFYKKITPAPVNMDSFQAAYGKPDGEYRTLYTLVGTGFMQMGSVTLTGLSTATETERDEIKNLLLTGIIL